MSDKHFLFNSYLPPEWRILTVDEIKSEEKYSCVAGPFGSNISAKFFVDDGVPVIRGANLTDDLTRFVATGFVFVSEDKARSFKAQHVRANDLVFTCWGTLGQVGLIPKDGPYSEYIISNKQLKLRVNTNICVPLYLFYYFATPQMIQHIQNIAIGSAVPGINLGLLKTRKVVLPPLQTQRKIAAILSAYDDLIENNNKRIALLERAAEEIYREWFVRLRFPGHEGVRFVKGIPEGWAVVELEHFCERVTDGTHDTPKPTEEGYYLVTGKNIKNGIVDFASAYKISEQDHRKISERSGLNPGDILFSNIGTLGSTAIVTGDNYSVKNVLIFKPIDWNQSLFLYHMLREKQVLEQLLMYSSGASQQFISLRIARRFKIYNPGQELIASFGQTVRPFQQKKTTLVGINRKLTKSRDLLLSRLISGKLEVDGLDIRFPPGMADASHDAG